jgi:uncharacterized protein
MANLTKTIVVDTSVFVSALLSASGASRQVLRRCLQKNYQPLIGATLYSEYESLVKRDGLFEDCLITSPEREVLLDAFLSVCRWVEVYYLWRPNLRDENDNHVLELAVAGNASAIVTHNIKDFKHGQLLFPQLAVITPGQLLKR